MYVRDAKYFIAPFFGFVVENSTYLDEISTKLVGNSTAPLKELPAQFTREGADDSAPHAQPDENSKSQSAGKPAVAAPTKKRKRKSSAPRPPAKRKPTDVRINHPAVQMVKIITKRFPPKDEWDRIIREIGDKQKIGNKPITHFSAKASKSGEVMAAITTISTNGFSFRI